MQDKALLVTQTMFAFEKVKFCVSIFDITAYNKLFSDTVHCSPQTHFLSHALPLPFIFIYLTNLTL